jgi:hypothetical protein
MPRFIPPVVHSGTKSEGEKQVFERLANDPATTDWTVLHSYDLPDHVRQLEGEIDFVILIPGRGVLCLSVKDCASASRINGMWYLGALKPDAQGPFKKAHDDKHSLIKKLEPQFERWKEKAPVTHAVVFTRLTSQKVNWMAERREWEDFEQVYSDQLGPSSQSISKALLRCMEGFRAKFQRETHLPAQLSIPSPSLCHKIGEFLRPDFEIFSSPKKRAGLVQSELKRYMAEQYACLDRASEEMRVFYRGRAGTGKTLLAIEAARRESFYPNRRTLVICYNRLIAKHLESELQPLHPKVVVRTMDAHLLKLGNFAQARNEPSFWAELPRKALERQLTQPVEEPFGTLILDEAQDILKVLSDAETSDVIDVLDLSLKGGLSHGRWLMFADDFQSIYKRDSTHSPFDVTSYCLRKGTYAAKADPLRINCRNLPLVSEYAQVMSNMKPGYSRVRRPDDQVLPKLIYYRSAEEQVSLLEGLIDQCLNPSKAPQTGFTGRCQYNPSEIVVLSTRTRGSCAEEISAQTLLDRMTRLDSGELNRIRHGTIHSFKGLEAPVVILTDIEQLAAEGEEDFNRSALLYVGISRSTERMAILAHSRVRDELEHLLIFGALS